MQHTTFFSTREWAECWLVVALPRETVALLDELKERQGLRNRSQVLLQLIERGREVTQQ